MSDWKNEWTGTKKEVVEIVEYCIDKIQEEMDIRIDAKEMRKLFCEAFARNIVQNELREMIAHILDRKKEA